MNVRELAAQLTELERTGHGGSEVRLRASFGEHVQVRSGVDGIQHELKVEAAAAGDQVHETILLWGRSG